MPLDAAGYGRPKPAPRARQWRCDGLGEVLAMIAMALTIAFADTVELLAL